MLLSVCGSLLATAGVALAKYHHHQPALATITPCPEAPTSIAPPPITVTRQYQAVSTCEPQSKCIRQNCWTQYRYNTYDYVSTVIPCPYGPSSVTTVTRTEQSILVSRSMITLTHAQPMPTVVVTRGSYTTTSTTIYDYVTVGKEWSAPYRDLGPLAIPGYSGSGLCAECQGPHGEELQVVEVVECIEGSKYPTECRKGTETWFFQPAPTSTSQAVGVCSTYTAVPTAGVFTFAFPQTAPPATVPVPARTLTYMVEGGPLSAVTTTVTATVEVFPARDWTAYVTRSCAGPTVFDFEVTVTQTLIYRAAPFVVHHPRQVSGLFLAADSLSPSLLPQADPYRSHTVPAPLGWGDWTSVATTTTTSSSGAGVGPVGISTSTSASVSTPSTTATRSAGVGPVGVSTSTSASVSTPSTTATSSAVVGPIGFSTSTSSGYTSTSLTTTSGGADVGPIGFSTSTSTAYISTYSTYSTSSSTLVASTSSAPISTSSTSTTATSGVNGGLPTTTSNAGVGPVGGSTSTTITSVGPVGGTTSATGSATSATSVTSASSLSSSASTLTMSSSPLTTSATFTTIAPSTISSSSSIIGTSTISSASTTITLPPSSTSAPSSTTIVTTTTASPPLVPFYLRILTVGQTSPINRRSTSATYVGFNNNNDALQAISLPDAAIFFLRPDSALISGGDFVGTETQADFAPLVRSATTLTGFQSWSFVGGVGTLQDTFGFCLGPGGAIEVLVDAGAACASPVQLVQYSTATSSSSSSVASSTTVSSTVTSTTITTTAATYYSSYSSSLSSSSPTTLTTTESPVPT